MIDYDGSIPNRILNVEPNDRRKTAEERS